MSRHPVLLTAAWLATAGGLTGVLTSTTPAAAAGPVPTPPGGLVAPAPTHPSVPEPLRAGKTVVWGVLKPGTTYAVEGVGFTKQGAGQLRLGDVDGPVLAAFVAGTDGRFKITFAMQSALVDPGDAATVVACAPSSAALSCKWLAAADLTVASKKPGLVTPTLPPPTTRPGRITAATTTTAAAPPDDVVTPTPPPTIPPQPDPELATPTTIGGDPPPVTYPDFVAPTTYAPPTIAPNVGVATTKPELPKAGDASLANLRITSLEVTQGLQDLQNRFPLVADRRTWVRVHARTDDEAPMPDVHAALEGVRNGQSLGLIDPEVDSIYLVHEPIRRLHDNTPYFKLPDSWTAEGGLTLRAWIYQGADYDASNEPTADDNLGTASVTFHPATPVTFHMFPLYLTEGFDPNGDPVIHDWNDGHTDAIRHARKLLPVGEVDTALGWPQGDEDSNWDLSGAEGTDQHAPNAHLQELHELGDYDDTDIFVGMVHTSLDTKFGGLSSGEQSIWVKMDNWFGGTNTWNHDAGGTLAHETGHAFNLKHAPCKNVFGSATPGEVAGGAIDPTFPGSYAWPDCSLAPTDVEGFYGFDPRPEWAGLNAPTVLTNSNDTAAPNRAYPFMGYAGAGWLDPYHGCRVLQFLGVPCDPAALGVPAATGSGDGGGIPTPAPGTGNGGQGGVVNGQFQCKGDGNPCSQLATETPFDNAPLPPGTPFGDLVVVGYVDPVSGSAHVLRSTRVPEHQAEPLSGAATHRIVVRAADGAETVAPLEVRVAGHGPIDPKAPRWFVTRVPAPETVASIVVADIAGAEVGRLEASASAPNVALDEATMGTDGSLTVRWTAADTDGDAPTAVVQMRGDGGPWETLGTHLSGSELRIGSERLFATGVREVRVLASDGVLTSDAATLTLPEPAFGTRQVVVTDDDAAPTVHRSDDAASHAAHANHQPAQPSKSSSLPRPLVGIVAAAALAGAGAIIRRRWWSRRR